MKTFYLGLFLVGLALHHATPAGAFSSVSSVRLSVFVVILLSGTLAGTIHNIAIPTQVAFIVPEDRRDRANGMFGTTIRAGRLAGHRVPHQPRHPAHLHPVHGHGRGCGGHRPLVRHRRRPLPCEG